MIGSRNFELKFDWDFISKKKYFIILLVSSSLTWLKKKITLKLIHNRNYYLVWFKEFLYTTIILLYLSQQIPKTLPIKLTKNRVCQVGLRDIAEKPHNMRSNNQQLVQIIFIKEKIQIKLERNPKYETYWQLNDY